MKRILFILLCTTCLLATCKPTPEKSIVQSKNDGVFEDKISNEMPPEKYSAPASYSERITKADVTLDIKATVSVPAEADRFPVAHISKISMSDEWIQNFISCISIDGKAYSYKSELVYTKSDVSDII